MRPDFARLAALDTERIRRRQPDLEHGLRIIEALREEAVALGVWPPEDLLGGIEVDLRVARAFNVQAAPR